MRDRRDPWKWPVTISLAVGLLWAVVFGLPRSWLAFLLAPRVPVTAQTNRLDRQVLRLLPPLLIEVVPAVIPVSPQVVEPPPPVPDDPRWWTEGWAVAAIRDTALFTAGASAPVDTVARVLGALGLGADFMTRAKPDSLLAARLFILQVEDRFRYDELKPFLTQMARSRAYADILSRAADMYDEHLSQEIPVPD